MARLPDSLPQDGVQGPGLPIQGLPPTDFGLGQAGDIAQAVAVSDRRARFAEQRAQDKADQDAVKGDYLKLVNANADQLAGDASKWNGSPGFAADQIQSYSQRATEAATNPAYTPGQRAAFRRLADQATQSAGLAAINHEAGVIQKTGIDQQEVVANGALQTFQTAYAAPKQALLDGYDGSQAGLATAGLSAFDGAAQSALESAPEALKPALQARLSVMRTEEQARYLEIEQKGKDAFILQNGTDQIKDLVNTISSNPSAYDSVARNNIPAIVATLPAGLRKDAVRQFTGMAAQARIKGLIDGQQYGQAKTELDDGRYDAVLEPAQKEELLARTDAENRAHGPEAIDRALAAQTLEQRLNADVYARATKGQATDVDLDAAAAVLSQQISPERYAAYKAQAQAADQAFAAVGPVRAMTNGQLATLRGQAPPDPADPAYTNKLQVWQVQQQAAAEEQTLRTKDPAAWAFDSTGAPAAKGAKGDATSGPQARGAQLQATLQNWLTAADPQTRIQSGGHLAGQSLGAQAHAGIAPTAWTLVPKAQAEALAASVVNAAPEQRLQALQQVGGLIAGLPTSFQMPDGTVAAPRQILARQLAAAHMTPLELSAAIDYGSNPAALGQVVAAINDPTLKAGMKPSEKTRMEAQAKAALQPFLNATMPLPGSAELEQSRIDRTVLTARELMATRGLSEGVAIATAAAPLLGGYHYRDTWRMPQGAGPPSLTRTGAAVQLGKLLAGEGALLYQPTGEPAGAFAAKVQHFSRWTTRPDDGGLMLVLPKADGGWTQVLDRWGRPISMGWQQLQAGADGTRPSPFAQPPPTAVHGPDGQPVPAASRAAAFSALSWAVTGAESRFRNGLASPKGARGLMQVMPDTVATYAPRLGLPVDLDRAQNDAAYNKKIGEAALSDNLQRYGSGAGVGLALAAYNWGPGHVDQALHRYGDPRTGQISLNDWVARALPKETRDYVTTVLPAALTRLQGRG